MSGGTEAAAVRGFRQRIRGIALGETVSSWLFVLPLVSLVVLLVLVPVVGTILNSFFRDTTFMPRAWVGLDNYAQLLRDGGFAQSLGFTLLFIAVSVPLEIGLGLLVAQLLHHPGRLRAMLRACCLIPWAIPAAVSARTWELIYNYNYGLANAFITGLGLSNAPVNWLGTAPGAFAALVIADAWKTTPFVAIILLAGLSAIPETLYKQAEVDGTNFLQRFTRITLPLLKPVLVVAFLFRTVDALRVFDLVYVLTSGGPGGSTTSLSLYGYRFLVGGDFGYGSAVSFTLFACALALSIAYVKIGRFGEGLR